MSEGPSLDLSAASAAAMEQLGAGNSPAPETPSNVPNPGQPPINEDPTVEVEFSPGKKEKVTLQQLKEWRENGLRQADYTKKTQETAEMRRQAEQVFRAYQQIAQEREELQEFFSNEENVLRLVAQQYGPQAMNKLISMLSGQNVQQQQVDPNSPATLAQAQAIASRQVQNLQQQIQQLQQQLGENVDQKLQALKYEQEVTEYKKVLDPIVHKIFDDHPILSAVDGMEEVIRYKVYKMDPQTVEETIDAFNKVAKEQVEKLTKKFSELNTHNALRKQQLTSAGLEPPGGSAPTPEPKRFKKGNDIDWKAISASATEYLNKRGGM